jgi:hypothetical protein
MNQIIDFFSEFGFWQGLIYYLILFAGWLTLTIRSAPEGNEDLETFENQQHYRFKK